MATRRRSRRGKARSSGASRWTIRILVGVVVVGVLGLLGGYIWLKGFLGSDRFLAMVNEKVGEGLKAEARFSKFEWDGLQLNAPLLEVNGEEMVRRIDMEGMETEVKFSPLLSKKVKTQDIHVRRMHVELDIKKDGPEFKDANNDAFSFRGIGIDEFSGEVDFGGSALEWENVTASISPGYTKGTYDATLVRGQVKTPLALFPDPRLQEANLRYADKTLFLKNGDWKVYDSGRLSADGEMDFGSGLYSFNGALTNVMCEEILPDDWKKRLRGQVGSEFTVEGKGKEAPVIKGSLQLDRGHLTALPVLDRIAAYTDTERFRRLGLRKATLDYRQEGDTLELSNIVIASEGLLRIEGRIAIVGGRLDGRFQLGVTPGTLAAIPGAESKVFNPGKMGMLWAPVRVTGSTELPKEDLSERLIAAAGERMFEMVPETGQMVLKHSGRAASEMAKTVMDKTAGAVDIGTDLIGQGAEILRNGVTPAGGILDPIKDGVGGVLNGILGPSPAEIARQKQAADEAAKKKADEAAEDAEDDAKKETQKAIDEQEGKTVPEKVQKVIEGELGVPR